MSLLAAPDLRGRALQRTKEYLEEVNITIDYDNRGQVDLVTKLVKKFEDEIQYDRLTWFEPYEYQRPLYHLHTMAQAVIASNRSGKSYSVGYAIACHLTGIYPWWWTDIRYETGIKLIAAGASSAQIREAIQDTLFGTADKTDIDAIGTGLIPRDNIIIDSIVTGSDKRGIGGCQIRHQSGRISTITIATYEQDRAVLQGGKADVIWLDEQPKDDTIVSELIRALAQTPSQQEGRLYLSATPLVGWTDMIKRFWNGEDNHGMVRYTWDDVPLELLDQKTRDLLISSWLPWEIDSRTKGIPMAGEGAVFQVHWRDIILESAPAIAADFKLIAGIDFGRSPDPTAIIWLAQDPRTKIIYCYDEYCARAQTPLEYTPHILNRGRHIPLAWPADGKRKGYTETESVINELTNVYGINTLGEHFTNPDGSRGIDYGLQWIIQKMRFGEFKISPHCTALIEELQQYHTTRTGNGKVTFRGSDHLIDALRYAALSIERYGSNALLRDGYQDELELMKTQRYINSWSVNTY
jgi:phage terminase large subunit-like protein